MQTKQVKSPVKMDTHCRTMLSRSQDQSYRLQPAAYQSGKYRITVTLSKLPEIHKRINWLLIAWINSKVWIFSEYLKMRRLNHSNIEELSAFFGRLYPYITPKRHREGVNQEEHFPFSIILKVNRDGSRAWEFGKGLFISLCQKQKKLL